MNSVYLILAHKNPTHLYHLIQALDSDQSIFIIHIDKKIAIRPFIKYFEKHTPGKILFCPNRIKVKWGCYSMVQATMALINFMFQLKIKAEYVHLISGQDYPLKSAEEISLFFQNNSGKNFMTFFSLPDQRWPENGMNRILHKWGVNRNECESFSDIFYKSENPFIRHLPDNIIPYGGSQWWSLHIDCVRYIQDEYLNNNILFHFYRYSLVPDEMLFQTLILNSPFKNSVINNSLRYINWQKDAVHPDIISLKHLDEIFSGDFIFARKFDTEHDSSVIAHIDKYKKDKGKNRLNKVLLDIRTNDRINCCIISTVGKNSLHREWINKDSKYDLHLIVYDESFEKYKDDTNFIISSKGFKFNLVYNYLTENKHLLNLYDYFYIPDDDISINVDNIHRLFFYMKEYNLSIAQPSIINSYLSYPHTQKQFNSLLRFTNFVEVMQPCFSRDALKKVLFTFNENRSGWGIDFHWGKIIDYRLYNMAVIDDVESTHSRPVQSNHYSELNNYINKYNLSMEIIDNY